MEVEREWSIKSWSLQRHPEWKEMAFEKKGGHDYEIDGDHYFSGYGDQRKLDQSLVNLQGLAKATTSATLHLRSSPQ